MDFNWTFFRLPCTGAVLGASSCCDGAEPFVEVERFLSAVCFTPSTVDGFLFAADRSA